MKTKKILKNIGTIPTSLFMEGRHEMTEPKKEGEHSILDVIEEEPQKKGLHLENRHRARDCPMRFGFHAFLGKGPQAASPKKEVSEGVAPIGNKDPQYGDITDFAEKFSIMAFNISYTDINHQVDKVANLMSDNMMSYYQEAFLDPKWVAFLSDNKAYVSYQQIDRSSVENTDGTHYWVKVIGKNLYNSDARGPSSQIELPFHLVVVVKRDNGKLIVTDFQRF
jgi:hypothetical protein